MQNFASGEAKFCTCGAGSFSSLDAFAAFRYADGVSTHVSISECGTMPEAGGSDQKDQMVTKDSPPDAKIELFRSLFRGRADVYPRRFESRKTGKASYQPACANEWIRGVCEKPKIKCADCPNRRLLPVTDEVIRWHLSGRNDQGRDFVMGVYPMLQDETCHFLAVDFDRENWQEDAGAFLETCRQLDLPAALERSRSGNGGHVWFFFEEAISAGLARKLGSHVLTETMENRPEIGLGSYGRELCGGILHQLAFPQGAEAHFGGQRAGHRVARVWKTLRLRRDAHAGASEAKIVEAELFDRVPPPHVGGHGSSSAGAIPPCRDWQLMGDERNFCETNKRHANPNAP
jgi:hypothetical protein